MFDNETPLTPNARLYVVKQLGLGNDISNESLREEFAKGLLDDKIDVAKLRELSKIDYDAALMDKARTEVEAELNNNQPQGSNKSMSGPSAKEILGNTKSGSNIRVKPESEKYLNTKSATVHPKLGTKMIDDQGRECMTPSDLDRAKTGVYFKWLANRQGKSVGLSDHERGLWEEVLANDEWCGDYNGEYHKSIEPGRIKALLSDSTSGGVYANPTWFDEQAISAPLLTGELLPLVTLQEMPRGSIAETPKVGPISAVWGVGSGTAAPLFDTDSLITEVEHNIFPITCALEVGDDMLMDTPLALGTLIISMIGERFASELDMVIAVGNGTSQPEGIMAASGITSVTAVNAASGPHALADYEGLLFAIGKQYRQNNNSCAFGSNDVSYRRSRAIQNDPQVSTTDQRRIFGMEHENYETLGRPHKIQNNMTNAQAFFGNLKYYRLRRRAGMELRVIRDTDWQLLRENKQGFLARARYGGGVVLSDAFAKVTNFQS